jgi:hypothetical protein
MSLATAKTSSTGLWLSTLLNLAEALEVDAADLVV